jgi:ABC-2 type transport system permease protein
MRQFLVIAQNAFMELVRQPTFLLLMTGSACFQVFLASTPYFGMGDDVKMVKDMTLAVTLFSGLLASVLCASSSLAQEIRAGTALTVLSKPVDRIVFLLGKYAGLAAALTLLTYVNMVAALHASRMAFDAYGDVDLTSVVAYGAAVCAAYAAGGFSNYFLRRPFVADAVWALTLFSTLAVWAVATFTQLTRSYVGVVTVDWRLLPAGVLILFALWLLAALALACSTRFDALPTLLICGAIFLAGLVSDYFFKGAADHGAWWAKVAYAAAPNWQQFWLADALENQKAIPWSYVGNAAVYLVAAVAVALGVGLWMFEDRELS